MKLIDNLAFCESGIKKFIIPKSVTKIGYKSFGNCQELTEIQFEENSELNTIDDSAFYKTTIENICFPPSVKQLGKSIFCDSLHSI